MNYTTSDAETMFNVSPQTIRNWAKEFSPYLSVTANPQENRTRIFTEDDMRVLDLVSRMKDDGKQYDEIHVALSAGQRGDDPALSPEEVRAIVGGEAERRLNLEIRSLKRQLEISEQKSAEYEAVKAENIRLQAILEQMQQAENRQSEEMKAQIAELKAQVKFTQEELRRLEREAGESYYKGRLDEAQAREKGTLNQET